ncbi:MAG: hypothetical protein KY397_02255 [Gemmatimonadetes bacterium]|nr:hypothetical protein [Gemmatimonadota bacterium]
MRSISTLLSAGLVSGLALLTACSDASPTAPDERAASPIPPSDPPAASAPAVGEVRRSTPEGGAGTVRLAFEVGSEVYLLAFESAAASAAPFDLSLDAAVPANASRAPLGGAGTGPHPEAEILEIGYDLLDRHGAAAPHRRALAPATATRTFWVLDNQASRWVERPARLAYEGVHSLVYVDVEVPAGDFPTDAARDLGQSFDRSVYDRIRGVFGEESDLDGNGKVVVLLTPIVNAQTSPKGRVYGFFMPGDLADFQYGNGGEIFYLLAPDPSGRFGPATPTADGMRDPLVAVAAHEFVHMISANQRRLARRLPTQAYWLEEGLAHFGELVVDRLSAGNILGFLSEGTTGISLVGSDVLTRGASTLFVVRLDERFGRGVVGRLVSGQGVGTATVETVTGEAFGESFHDWSVALHNELYPVAGISQTFGTLDLEALYRDRLGSPQATNALGRVGARVPAEGSKHAVPMLGGTVAYVVVRSERSGALDLGYRAPTSADLQVAAIRIR